MKPKALTDYMKRSTKASGVPRKVQDKSVLRRLAKMLQ